MIVIRNRQRTVVCSVDNIKHEAEIILRVLKYADFDLGIELVSDRAMRVYNRDYRKQDKPTDVLSFPYHPELKAGERIVTECEDDHNLGDLIIAPAYVTQDAQRLGVTFEQRMRRMLVHGICHLLGYDHIEDADYAVMIKKERYLLKRLRELCDTSK